MKKVAVLSTIWNSIYQKNNPSERFPILLFPKQKLSVNNTNHANCQEPIIMEDSKADDAVMFLVSQRVYHPASISPRTSSSSTSFLSTNLLRLYLHFQLSLLSILLPSAHFKHHYSLWKSLLRSHCRYCNVSVIRLLFFLSLCQSLYGRFWGLKKSWKSLKLTLL